MGLLTKYSGITAIFVYLLLLWLYTKFIAGKKTERTKAAQEIRETEDTKKKTPLDMNDEDAVVASLVAAIECRNEYQKNVRIVSVRKVA